MSDLKKPEVPKQRSQAEEEGLVVSNDAFTLVSVLCDDSQQLTHPNSDTLLPGKK